METNLEFCSLASGSSGNSYMIKSDETVLLVDVGISGKRIKEGLEKTGVDPEKVQGLLITHEHIDHVRSVRIMQKHCPNTKIYANVGTWKNICENIGEGRSSIFETGTPFSVGDIDIMPFATSHDASEPVGFAFKKANSKISIVTDTGYVSDDIRDVIQGSNLLLIESNHDENVLKMGKYPYEVKRRILSELGHLSNEAAAECICQFVKGMDEKMPKPPKVLLAHLSKENNTPDMALLTIKNYLEEENLYDAVGITREEFTLEVLKRDKPGRIFRV